MVLWTGLLFFFTFEYGIDHVKKNYPPHHLKDVLKLKTWTGIVAHAHKLMVIYIRILYISMVQENIVWCEGNPYWFWNISSGKENIQ